MRRGYFISGAIFRAFLVLIFQFLVLGEAMSGQAIARQDRSAESDAPMSFSIYFGGGMFYGTNSMGVSEDGVFHADLGDSSRMDYVNGVGTFELNLNQQDRRRAQAINAMLCRPDAQSRAGAQPLMDRPAMFSATCIENGKLVEKLGHVDLVPKHILEQAIGDAWRLFRSACIDGKRLVKLDIYVVDVKREKDNFLVTVRFSNRGAEKIRFKRPDKWSGQQNFETLTVGAPRNSESEHGWLFRLAGLPLTNSEKYPDDEIVLDPGASADFSFLAEPEIIGNTGAYIFGASVTMDAYVIGNHASALGHVVFDSDSRTDTRITIDRDYPSTPQEREQWEAKHRADMSFHPVNPGETFVEDGLYRAVRLITVGDYRSLQLKPFKAGDVATTEGLRMFMQSEYGGMLNGEVQWVWEGSAPTPVKPFSPDIITETQHTCEAGAVCPRAGRWLARVRTGRGWSEEDYHYDLAGIVTRRRGERMPKIASAGPSDYGLWEWLGV